MEKQHNNTPKIIYIGVVPFFLMTIGLGMFLEYQHYASWAFALVYVSIFGLPYMWALMLLDLTNFDHDKAFFYGLTATVLFAMFHAIYYFADGSNESFLVFVPIVVWSTAVFSASLYKRK